jgi:hypothetical protein
MHRPTKMCARDRMRDNPKLAVGKKELANEGLRKSDFGEGVD